MGPQLDSCGRLDAFIDQAHGYALQWGRNLTVAEGRKEHAWHTPHKRFNGAAT